MFSQDQFPTHRTACSPAPGMPYVHFPPSPLCVAQTCATAPTCPSSRSSVSWRSSCRCTVCGRTPSTAMTTMTGCTRPSLHRTPGSTLPPSRSKRHSNTSVSLTWSYSAYTNTYKYIYTPISSAAGALDEACGNFFSCPIWKSDCGNVLKRSRWGVWRLTRYSRF